MDLDPILLSRLQFAFTISFHIIFPTLTIGLSSWLVVVEGLWLLTKKNVYQELYKLWIKVFAVTFGMGVVSGVVMSYQFGTNWSRFSDSAGNILGPLLAFEVLTAFFLEASFLGVMLFGWGRVTKRMHFVSTLVVALGTLISAFWILSANSWMQTPTGYEIRSSLIFHPTNWMEIVFNPSFPYRFLHMVTAAYLTTAFFVSGIGAWYLLQKRYIQHARIMVGMAMLMAVFVTPVQIFLGHLHGLNTLAHQPAKIAAMEGIWETERGAPLLLVGWPDQKREQTTFALSLPKLSSLVLTHTFDGEVKGLKEWAPEDRPAVLPVFWSFRVMVGISFLMLLTGGIAVWLAYRKRLFESAWFQRWCILLTPSGFIAVLAGWFVTEIGRQPYIIYGLMRTAQAASPVRGEAVFFSLVAFVVIYSFVFGSGIYYVFRIIQKGPKTLLKEEDVYGAHGLTKPVL